MPKTQLISLHFTEKQLTIRLILTIPQAAVPTIHQTMDLIELFLLSIFFW